MSKRRNRNTFLRVLSGASLAVILGGGVAFAIPQSRDFILDKLAPYSNEYKLKLEEIDKLTLENQAKQNTIDLLNEELENKNAELETTKTNLEDVTAELEIKKVRISELESEIEALELEKGNISMALELLREEKATLQAEFDSLTQEKVTLQTRVTELEDEIIELNNQLAEYEMYKVEIDKTNSISEITIEDTKLSTNATLTNLDVDIIELYSWQNVTITYEESETGTLFATLNGKQQETNTITLNGSENKGLDIVVSSVIVNEEQKQVTSASLFTFNGNAITSYKGTETDIVIPTSYSLGEKVPETKVFTNSDRLNDYLYNNGFNATISVEESGETISITSEEDYMNYMTDIDIMVRQYGLVNVEALVQTYVDGNDYEITTINAGAFLDTNVSSIYLSEKISIVQGGAFMGCNNLISIDVAENNETFSSINGLLTSKDKTQLKYCPNALLSCTIPSSITSFIWLPFYYCTNLVEINVEDGNSAFSSINGVLYNYEGTELITCPWGKVECVINKGVETIQNSAFAKCTNLTNVYFTGTEEEWNAITIDTNNDALTNATKTYNYVAE